MAEELRQRAPRVRDDGYLKWLRKQACACGCTQPAPCDPAHIKSASEKHGKPSSGTMRPDDMWCLPLKRLHHDAQHAHGNELDWWKRRGIDPFEMAISYYRLYRSVSGLVASTAKKPRAKRLPRAARTIGDTIEVSTSPKAKRKARMPKGRALAGTKASGIKRGFDGKVTMR